MWKIGNVEIKNRIVFAPMAGVSNISFRTIIKEMGAGLIYSEMVSTMGITYDSKKTIKLLKLNESERPISIQIFGCDVNAFVKAAKFIDKNIKPDIIDINMGCPVPKIAIKSQAGSSLLKSPEKIEEIVKAVVDTVSCPVTVKIRSGWDENSINAIEVAKIIEEAGASAICIHPRTRSQGYTGLSNWKIIKDVKDNVNIPVIGNGDIHTIYDAERMLKETNCDAVMIGRETLGNPWIIKECVEYIENGRVIEKPTFIDKTNMLKRHFELLEKYENEKTALLEIRMHALWYIKGLPNNKEIKNKIVSSKTKEELFNIIDEYKNYLEQN